MSRPYFRQADSEYLKVELRNLSFENIGPRQFSCGRRFEILLSRWPLKVSGQADPWPPLPLCPLPTFSSFLLLLLPLLIIVIFITIVILPEEWEGWGFLYHRLVYLWVKDFKRIMKSDIAQDPPSALSREEKLLCCLSPKEKRISTIGDAATTKASLVFIKLQR